MVIAAVLAAVFAASACTFDLLPGGGKAPELFLLSPKSTFDADLPNVEAQLVIETPIASEGLNTHRMALRESPLTLDYFAGARWSERAPRLVQTVLVESFENTKKIISVARQGVDLRSDYSLKTELREFQAEYRDSGSAPEAWVRLNAKLVRMPARMILASQTFEARAKSKGTAITEVVRAFDAALNKVLRRTVEWTLTEMDADYSE